MRHFVSSKSPPFLLALLIFMIVGLFSTSSSAPVASPAPAAVAILLLVPVGAFVTKRVILPDFMSPRLHKRNRLAKRASGSGRMWGFRVAASRYFRPRATIGREKDVDFGSHLVPMRT